MQQNAPICRSPQQAEAFSGVSSATEAIAWLRQQGVFKRPHKGAELGYASTGINELDAILGGGLPTGVLCELCGNASSGRTALAMALVARITQKGALAVWVDPADALDPRSLKAAGTRLERLLWVRPQKPRPLQQAMQAVDALLDGGGFGLVVLDMLEVGRRHGCDRPGWWIRLSRRLEHARNTVMLSLVEQSWAGPVAHTRLRCSAAGGKSLQEDDLAVRIERRRGSPPGARAVVRLHAPGD